MMDIFRSRGPKRRVKEHVLAVEAGQTMCPRRGIVDIEDCWVCPAYRGMSRGSVEGLVCGPEPMTLPFEGRSAIM